MTDAEYVYKGARALVLLHDEKIRSFYNVWKEAKVKGVMLPETSDPDYESMDTLLVHILRSAGGYMRWICGKLELPDPQISQVPSSAVVEKEAESYIDHLLEKWRLPLAAVNEEKFFNAVYKSNWGPEFCIESMLEHAVMHPMRHEFQLRKLMGSL